MIKLLIIYFIIINVYFYTKRKHQDFAINARNDLVVTTVVLLGFVIGFFGFVRILNLFREHKIIDIKLFLYSFDIVMLLLIAVMLYWLRKNLMYWVKFHWIKYHYFYMCDFLPYHQVAKPYRNFFFYYWRPWLIKFYEKTYYFNIFFTTMIVLSLCCDLWFNHGVLDFSLVLTPWYGAFKLLYSCARFIAIKQQLDLDYYLYYYYYMWFAFDKQDIFYQKTYLSMVVIYRDYEKKVLRV